MDIDEETFVNLFGEKAYENLGCLKLKCFKCGADDSPDNRLGYIEELGKFVCAKCMEEKLESD